jgi:FixJ family two-component response regulator
MSAAPLIHVVDDDESMRTALLELLAVAGFEARGHASTGEFLLHAVPDRPGCVLLDVRLPGPSGLELQAALRQQGTALPVVFLTGHADVATSVRAMKAGAVDFLEKPVGREVLLEALHRALARDAAERATREEARGQSMRLAALTPREREVFERLVAGKRNKEIAAELGIGLRTVKAYRAQLMVKLGVGSPAERGRLAGARPGAPTKGRLTAGPDPHAGAPPLPDRAGAGVLARSPPHLRSKPSGRRCSPAVPTALPFGATPLHLMPIYALRCPCDDAERRSPVRRSVSRLIRLREDRRCRWV